VKLLLFLSMAVEFSKLSSRDDADEDEVELFVELVRELFERSRTKLGAIFFRIGGLGGSSLGDLGDDLVLKNDFRIPGVFVLATGLFGGVFLSIRDALVVIRGCCGGD